MNGRIHGGEGIGDSAVRGGQRPVPLYGPGRGACRPSKFEAVCFGPGWDRAGMTSLDASLRRAVLAYLKRSGLSGMQFGQLALGNPGFVLGLDRDRSLTVENADRVLRFMGQAPIGPMFRREMEVFLGVTGTGEANLGLKAAGDPFFVEKLRQGASYRLTTVQRVRTWMRDTASEAERASIARILAGSEETAPALDPDPAALRALAGSAASPPDPDSGLSGTDEPAFLTTRQAAALLSLSPRTLDRYRVAGKGPPFHRFGSRIAYARADLEEWAAQRRRGRPPTTG